MLAVVALRVVVAVDQMIVAVLRSDVQAALGAPDDINLSHDAPPSGQQMQWASLAATPSTGIVDLGPPWQPYGVIAIGAT